MSTWTTSDVAELYKERFAGGVSKYLPQKSDCFALIKNESDKGGEPWTKVIRSNAVRRSTRAESAIANRNAASYTAFKIDLAEFGEEYAVVSVGLKAVRSTGNSENALLKVVEEAVDSMLEALALAFDHKLCGNGGGAKGRVEPASVSTTTFQLQNSEDVYFWYPGMRIKASSDDGATASPAGVRSGVLEVSGVNPNGTITCTQNITTGIPAFDDTGAATAVDFLFEEDDYDNYARRILQGFRAWNPKTAPSGGESFFNVDRSTNIGVLAGQRVDGAGAHLFDTLRDACAKVTINRGKPDLLLVGAMKMAEIEQVVGAKQEFMLQTDYPDVGIRGIKLNTAAGPIDVVMTPAYPSAESTLTKRASWCLGSIGPAPHAVNDDGQTWRVEEGKAAMQSRQQAFVQLMCEEPWHSCHITW